MLDPDFAPLITAEHWRYRDVTIIGNATVKDPGVPEGDERLMRDHHAVIAVQVGDLVRVYPCLLMLRNGVINDTLADRTILVYLDRHHGLGFVYDRNILEHRFTFADSGYMYEHTAGSRTYLVDLLWDRDTESLWSIALGQAISGPMCGAALKPMDERFWRRTTWGEVRRQHPDAQVLMANQHYLGMVQPWFPRHRPTVEAPQAAAAAVLSDG